MKLDRTNSLWEQLDLGESPDYVVGDHEQLSGFATPDWAYVLYKTPLGSFQAFLFSNDGEQLRSIKDFGPAEPRLGGPHHILPDDQQLNLFYVNLENSICHLVLEYSKGLGSWERKSSTPLHKFRHSLTASSTDRDLEDAEFSAEISGFTVLPGEQPGTFTLFVISGSELDTIDASGRTNLGLAHNGEFSPASSRCLLGLFLGRPAYHVNHNVNNFIIQGNYGSNINIQRW